MIRAVYVDRLAAVQLIYEMNSVSVTASDVIEQIPSVNNVTALPFIRIESLLCRRNDTEGLSV